MTRRQVAVDDLPSLFESLFDKRIDPIRNEAEGLCDKTQDWLNEVKNTASKLLKENIEENDDTSKSSISSADKFGHKIINLVEAVEAPKEMTYNNLVAYTNTLRNFQSQIVNAASIWIPRLPLQLKGTIRELETKMKLLGHSVNSLENHVSGKHRQVDKLEKILEDSKLLSSLHSELNDLDSAIKRNEENTAKLDTETDNIEQEINKLGASEISRNIAEQETQLRNLCNQISEIFEPLEKPIEKLSKTVDSKKGLLPSEALDILQRYVHDPVGAVQNEEVNLTRLRPALESLRNVLAAGAIELKQSRVKNALKSISEISSGSSLMTLRQSYRQLQIEHHATSSSKGAMEIAARKAELDNRKQQMTNQRSTLGSDLKVLKARRSELSLRISRLKTDLEDRSKKSVGEEIGILEDS